MAPLRFVFRLHFQDKRQLEAAFARLVEAEQVGSCIIEPDPMHLLFQASAPVAEPLIDRIYAEGGLSWCTRHTLQEFR